MSCIVYITIKNPNNAVLTRELDEFIPFYTHVQTVGAEFGVLPFNWDLDYLNSLPNEFFADGLDHVHLRATEIPNFEDLAQLRARNAEHELDLVIRQYNADHNITVYRKVVDADTHETLVDWELV